MFNFKGLTLEDKPLIDSFIKPAKIESSEMSFTNLFIWGASSNLQYAIYNDALYITFKWDEKNPKFFLPVSKNANPDYKELLKPIQDYYNNDEKFSVLCITKAMKEKVEAQTDDFLFIEDRDNFDYIYNTQDLIGFTGKKYHSKRNFINRLLMSHEVEYEEYEDKHFQECWELYSSWYRSKDREEVGMDGEPLATNATLSFYKELGLKGAVIKVDGKIQAFTFGEQVTDNMAVIHLEKANADIAGLYPYTTQQFAQNAWENVEFLNRMEDMGIEGLRKAKLSLHPARMIEKYVMKMKNS